MPDQVAGLRESLQATKDDAREIREYSGTLDRHAQSLQRSLDAAYAELSEAHDLIAKV